MAGSSLGGAGGGGIGIGRGAGGIVGSMQRWFGFGSNRVGASHAALAGIDEDRVAGDQAPDDLDRLFGTARGAYRLLLGHSIDQLPDLLDAGEFDDRRLRYQQR